MVARMARPRRALRADLRITSLAPGGDGVAHADIDGERRAIFVPHAAPGDLATVDVDPTRRPARGHLVAVVEPGPDRVVPACPWSTRCGGCDWMHVSLPAQTRAHVDQVRAALPASWRDVAIESHAAGAALAYRSRARVHVRCERGRVDVGMHEAGTHDPVAVDACAVLTPAVETARRSLAALFDGCRGQGDVQIALGAGGCAVLEVRWGGELAPAFFGRLEKMVQSTSVAGARITEGDSTRPAVVGDPTPWMLGADDHPLRLAPGGFAQASEASNAALARHVAGVVAPLRADKAVELFAGAGNLTVVIASVVPDLVAVESSRSSCDAARANLAARSLHARIVEGDAEAYAWSPATRLVVLDPPRTGARAVAERLASSRVAHVVYVACDPQTLGRDLAVLAEGGAYEPRSVATFEMFPQTSHVETVVHLERTRARRPAGHP
jgi:23S rRNA (uracil1939-C5)-methyltransferase